MYLCGFSAFVLSNGSSLALFVGRVIARLRRNCEKDNYIIILRGNSGSGKTTVARALQKKFGYNTMMISQDEIRENILWVKDGVDTKALPLMIELMKYGYEHCDVVILEGIMYDEWYSPLFKTANELYGMDIYAYYFDIPFEETVRRHNTRDKKQEFGEEDMRRWWREKDFSSVFNEKIITSDIDADSIVEMIYIYSANEG